MHLVSVSYFLDKNYMVLFDFLNAACNGRRIMHCAMPLCGAGEKVPEQGLE